MSEPTLPTKGIQGHPRFVEGSYARSRELEQAGESLESLKTINPEIVGATLFGSALKGTASVRSDIDMVVFLDSSMLQDYGIGVDVDSRNLVTYSNENFADEYKNYLATHISRGMRKPTNLIERGIYIEPISKDIIDVRLKRYFGYAYAKKSWTAEALKIRKTYWSDFLQGSAREEDYPDLPEGEPEYLSLGWGIGALFKPELTSGLENHRSYVLQRLDESEYGEDAWRTIKHSVEFGEGHMDIEDPAVFPQSLEEAMYEFSPPLTY